MPYCDAGGSRIYYERHGPRDGAPAIVFAHGAGGNHLSWWQQVPHFSHRWTCITFDHRGFALSADAPGGPGGAAFVDDLRALLDHLGIERASLVAQSMGGWTCLGFAVRYPQRVELLVMADTHGGLVLSEIGEALRGRPNADALFERGIHPAAGERMFLEQPDLHFLYQEIAALNFERADLATIIRAAGTVTYEQAHALEVPVLFIAGVEDVVLPPRVLELAAPCFKDARLERVPATGHSVYFERADTFNAIVQRFLESS